MTVEQFMELPPDEVLDCELVRGEIVRAGDPCTEYGGFLHERIKANGLRLLMRYVFDHPIGEVFSETMYKLSAEEAQIPDVSLLLNERIPARATNQPLEGAPDLAFEVVSSESAISIERKINLYLATGARAVWVAYPDERTLWVHRPKQSLHLYQGDYLEEPDLLPGFRVVVDRLFDGI